MDKVLVVDSINKIKNLRVNKYDEFVVQDIKNLYRTEEGIRLTPNKFGTKWSIDDLSTFVDVGAVNFSLLGVNYVINKGKVLKYDGNYFEDTEVLLGSADFAVVIECNDFVLVVGGEDDTGLSNDIRKITVVDGGIHVEVIGSFTEGISRAVGVCVGDFIYIIGGKTPNGASRDIYETADGVVWNKVGELSDGLYNASLLNFKGDFYIVSGETDLGTSSVLYKSSDGKNWVVTGTNNFYSRYKNRKYFVYGDYVYTVGGFLDGYAASGVYKTDDLMRYELIGRLMIAGVDKHVLEHGGVLVIDGDVVSLLYGTTKASALYIENKNLYGSCLCRLYFPGGDYAKIYFKNFGAKYKKIGDANIKFALVDYNEDIIIEDIKDGDIIGDLDRLIYDLYLKITITRGNLDSDIIFKNAKIYYLM